MKSRTTGFTLIEILVVLLIVSIMSGLVIANMPSMTRTADFETEVKRLQLVLELAREEALMQSSEFGFRVNRKRASDAASYSFLIYDDLNQTWSDYAVPPLQSHDLPEDMALFLDVEGEGFSLEESDEEGLPPVMLLSSGETTPFDLTISLGRELAVTLRADGYTRISPVDPDEA